MHSTPSLILIVLSRLDRGIYNQRRRCWPWKWGGVLYIVLTVPHVCPICVFLTYLFSLSKITWKNIQPFITSSLCDSWNYFFWRKLLVQNIWPANSGISYYSISDDNLTFLNPDILSLISVCLSLLWRCLVDWRLGRSTLAHTNLT